MDPHKETPALHLVRDKKRKSEFAAKVVTPIKKVDIKPENDQPSGDQQSAQPDLPDEARTNWRSYW
jgi:hypothetical protein